MDEREKEVFRKIYAELYLLIMIGCALSLIIKSTVFLKDLSDCIPEYLILVGSPIYLAIRTRMLGVTQVSRMPTPSKGRWTATLISTLTALFIFAGIRKNSVTPVDWKELMGFAVTFTLVFMLTQIGYRKLEERRQKKLDSRYED